MLWEEDHLKWMQTPRGRVEGAVLGRPGLLADVMPAAGRRLGADRTTTVVRPVRGRRRGPGRRPWPVWRAWWTRGRHRGRETSTTFVRWQAPTSGAAAVTVPRADPGDPAAATEDTFEVAAAAGAAAELHVHQAASGTRVPGLHRRHRRAGSAGTLVGLVAGLPARAAASPDCLRATRPARGAAGAADLPDHRHLPDLGDVRRLHPDEVDRRPRSGVPPDRRA